jgi:hypothetical protein
LAFDDLAPVERSFLDVVDHDSRIPPWGIKSTSNFKIWIQDVAWQTEIDLQFDGLDPFPVNR